MTGADTADRSGRQIRVGLDVGGTKIDAVAVDPSGHIRGRLRRPTGWGDDAVVESIVMAVTALADESGFPLADVGSVGIGDGTTAALTLDNAFAAGKLVIHKDITGAGATTWGTGPFTFDLSCTLAGHGTVFSRTGLTLTHINLLDRTAEGVECAEDYLFSVQYHPESAPGPQDSTYLFNRFIDLMESHKEGKAHA